MAYFYIVRQTQAEWEASDPILLDNQIGIISDVRNGIETESNRAKLGNGVDTWSELDYWSPNDQDGDVVGPSSATDNAAAVFDGTTGKLLKDGASINVLGKQFVGSFTTTATAAGTTTLTVSSNPIQEFTGSTTQTVVLPVVTTLPKTGFQFVIINNSSGALTVNSSGGNLVQTMPAGTRAALDCILLTGTSAASWGVFFIPAASSAGALTSPTLVTPALGTPASGVLDNCTTATASAGDNDTSLASTAFVARSADFQLASVQVQTNVGTKQSLYTVPANTKAIVTKVVMRTASTSLAAMGDSATLGFDAGATDYGSFSSASIANLTNATFAIGFTRFNDTTPGVFVIGNATDVFGIIFNDILIAGTVQIDVFGYLYAA